MNIGLALSGGGMRGVAQIGVIKALEEHGIQPTHVAGSSAGAIVGSLYAYGYNWEEIFDFFKNIQLLNITKYALGKPGIIDAEKFYPEFKAYIKKDNFDALEKVMFITATDILKGKLKIFKSGELIRPILASAAFPGVFAPVKIDDTYYIDGGALNNFPVEQLKPDCDIVIGAYVNGYQDISIDKLKHSYNVVERAFKLKSVQEDHQKFKDCDVIISPKELDNYATFDNSYLDEIFKIGYDAATSLLAQDDIKSKFSGLKKN
jgi:NTE family protein